MPAIESKLANAPGRVLLAILAGISLAAGCSSSNAGTDLVTESVTLPLRNLLGSIPVVAGQTHRITFTYALPPEEDIQGWVVNPGKSLQLAQVTQASPLTLGGRLGALAAVVTATGQVTVRVAAAQDVGTVCETGVAFGPFAVGLNAALLPESVLPLTVSATPQVLAVMKDGPFVHCVEITSPVDATIDVTGMVVDVTHPVCKDAPASLAGTWVGTYQCSSTCGAPFGGPITIVITQDGQKASYVDDSGATYAGTVCGNKFRLVRNDPEETERGVLTLNADGAAVKHSRYQSSSAPSCLGDCTDNLHRQ